MCDNGNISKVWYFTLGTQRHKWTWYWNQKWTKTWKYHNLFEWRN